jgi:hypothetical protein
MRVRSCNDPAGAVEDEYSAASAVCDPAPALDTVNRSAETVMSRETLPMYIKYAREVVSEAPDEFTPITGRIVFAYTGGNTAGIIVTSSAPAASSDGILFSSPDPALVETVLTSVKAPDVSLTYVVVITPA